MRIIPVVDLKNGYVVHGKGGRRAEYQPIQSILTESAKPLAVAQAIYEKLGCTQMYLADLDAIEGNGNHLKVIEKIARQLPLELIVDAGANSWAGVSQLLSLGVAKVIVGSETLVSTSGLREILVKAPEQVIFSIDMQAGKLLTSCCELLQLEWDELLQKLFSWGVQEIIILDLAAVGSGKGANLTLLEKTSSYFSRAKIIAGGGIRQKEDLVKLQSLGVDGVLVATAIHSGWLTDLEIKEFSGSELKLV
jgi:phosphoribosylformimino-5-aminoimidazole carboxamide ribotide isomerase